MVSLISLQWFSISHVKVRANSKLEIAAVRIVEQFEFFRQRRIR